MKDNREKMSGFLDGYVAGNIAANSVELKAHTQKISEFLKEAGTKLELTQRPQNQALATDLKEFATSHEKEIDNEAGFISYSMDLAELMKKTKGLPEVPTESNFLIKRAIYHFLNMSKTLENDKIVSMATNVANLYK